MSELPNEYTDKLFQEGAQQFDFTYNATAWNQMEEMLDAEKNRRNFISYTKYSVLGLIIFGGILLGISILSNPNITNLEADSNDSIISIESSLTSPTESEVKSSVELNDGENLNSPKSDNSSILETKDSSDINRLINPRQADKSTQYPIAEHNNRSHKTRSISSQSINSLENTPLDLKEINIASTTTPFVNKAEKVILEEKVNKDFKPLTTAKDIADNNVLFPEQLSGNELSFLSSSSNTTLEVLPSTSPIPSVQAATSILSRISLRAQGGLIYGYTSQLGTGMARTRFSIGADYALTNRITIGTGAGLNNLCYITDGSGYQNRQQAWFGGASPSRIEAQCRVLEVPIEGTYFFGNRKSSNFFVRGGLVSYFMLRENYTYSYDDSFIPPDVQTSALRVGWATENSNQHLMGVAQMSFGYQFALSPTRQLQIDGFVHAPLTGIGDGGVKVWSYGLNTALNLNLK